ncbi:HDOD domain-containing protein [Gemmatimonas groenlandica]|uniref:HDOD domain-containing protein n=1 Tax=Gemmatimonas groenlandica TaxID=2732249 RepID=A0A6M4IUR4_9BACT|nr:HDOD domain-containing protein [Gemmatimonas groenlandica]QJR37935.1 HDOD domain-containing protein [Gemmatimonas groenlandica]
MTTMNINEQFVRTALKRVTTVATLPTSAMRIMQIAEDPTSTENELLEVLEGDPPLAARVLKVVNSAFYGRPRQVGSTAAAMRLLGVNAVRNVALAASLNRLFRGGMVPGFDASALWTHSVAVGTAARRIAERCRGIPPEEAMLAGLLHDIGLLVAIQASYIEFTGLIAATLKDASISFADAETHWLGATHEVFGKALCEQWRFPHALTMACGHHHDPMALAEHDRRLPAVIHVADVLAGRVGGGFTRMVGREAPADGVCELLGLHASDLAAIEAQLSSDIEQSLGLLAA